MDIVVVRGDGIGTGRAVIAANRAANESEAAGPARPMRDRPGGAPGTAAYGRGVARRIGAAAKAA